MEPGEYEAMYELEDDLWWYRGQRRITKALLDRYIPLTGRLEVLDAGAGTGGSAPMLAEYGRVTAFDFSELAVAHCRERGLERIAQASVTHIPYRDGAFDLVTVFDVLTILSPAEEARALAEVARVLKPGGHFFWREPAHMLFYGPHDRAVHSKHRYNRGEMSERLSRAGLRPVRSSYSNCFLFPLAVGRRMVARFLDDGGVAQSDVRPVPGPINGVLTKVLAAEAPVVERVGLPTGLSVISLSRKP